MPASQEVIEELYERYGPILLARCRSILGNEEAAMDAVQETFARVIVHHDDFRDQASPLTWMYRISTNYCLNQIRNTRGRAEKRVLHHDTLAGEGVSRPETDQRDTARVIRRLIADADPETQALVVHLFFDDMSRAETATHVGISQPTLRKRLDQFMKRARRVLGDSVELCLPWIALALACAFAFTWGTP